MRGGGTAGCLCSVAELVKIYILRFDANVVYPAYLILTDYFCILFNGVFV